MKKLFILIVLTFVFLGSYGQSKKTQKRCNCTFTLIADHSIIDLKGRLYYFRFIGLNKRDAKKVRKIFPLSRGYIFMINQDSLSNLFSRVCIAGRFSLESLNVERTYLDEQYKENGEEFYTVSVTLSFIRRKEKTCDN